MQKVMDTVDNQLKGIHVQNLTPELRKKMELPVRVTGVIVSDINEDSPAEGTLMRGDIIMQINRKNIVSVKDYEALVTDIKKSQGIMILIYRNNSSIYVTLSPK
jgi:S1-C subfamily serine protease